MKLSIAISLIIIAAVFSFVSGYTIGSHSDQAVNYSAASQSVSTSQEPSAPSGGYGASSGAVSDKEASSPGYGSQPSPAPGYGSQPSPAPGYGGAPSPGYGQ